MAISFWYLVFGILFFGIELWLSLTADCLFANCYLPIATCYLPLPLPLSPVPARCSSPKIVGDALQRRRNDLEFSQVVTLHGVFHGLEVTFQTQFVIFVFESSLRPYSMVFEMAWNRWARSSTALFSEKLNVVWKCRTGIGIGQRLAAWYWPPVLGVIKRAVEVIGLLGILENRCAVAGDMVNST